MKEQRAHKHTHWPSWHHLGRELTIEEKKVKIETSLKARITFFSTAPVRRNGQFIWLVCMVLGGLLVRWLSSGSTELACVPAVRLKKLPAVHVVVSSSVFEGVSFSEMRIKLMKRFVYRPRRFSFFFSLNSLPNFGWTGNGLIFIYLFEIFCGSFDAINGLLIIGM